MTAVAFLDGLAVLAYNLEVEQDDVSIQTNRAGAVAKDRTYYEICLDVVDVPDNYFETDRKLSRVVIHDGERLVELRATPLRTADSELCFESTKSNVRVID